MLRPSFDQSFQARLALSALLGILSSCGSSRAPVEPVAGAQAWFEEVSQASGIEFQHVRARSDRYWLPEIMGGGAAWLDYDSDGRLDLYLVQSGDLESSSSRWQNQLFRNTGEGFFQNATSAAGVGDEGYGMGASAGDYDGDGDLDLYVTNLGANVLYRNQGNGTFVDVTAEAGVGHPGWGASSAFFDYDGDTHLDLFVVNYVNWSPQREIECSAGGAQRDYCQPQNYNAPATDVLYRNNGDGTFSDATRPSGIFSAKGNGLGVTAGDFDGDGRPDLYVANDGDPNQLWINNGDGTFTDRALLAGCAVNRHGMAEAGMGVVAADLENDGDLDLFMTHLRDESNTLYLNQGGLFEDATVLAGLSAPSIPLTGFGAGMADFDHDGILDLYVANGRVGRSAAPLADDPYAEPNQLYRGSGNGRFQEVEPRGGAAKPWIENSRAAAFGDYDGDGDIDVLVVNNAGLARLYRNQAEGKGNWIQFRLLDAKGRDAAGAMVGILSAGKRQWRLASAASSYLASNDPKAHFGLGSADRVEEAEILWPGGSRETFGPFAAGKVHLIRQGTSSQQSGSGR